MANIKSKVERQIIDFPFPGDQNIAIKEQEKTDKKVLNVKLNFGR